ncbi:MAG TPA: glycosyltransferase [Acidimicrobiia bacterium]|nr:glycosyltransferase [Acidimicrobiia bacterium]
MTDSEPTGSRRRPGRGSVPATYGFLSTYRPSRGGPARFAAALAAELQTGSPACRVGVVRVVDRVERSTRPEVVHHLVTTEPGGEAEAAGILNRFDAVIVQHDYAIYGGPDGDQVISVLARLTVPVIVVLHAVLPDPTPHQREVLEQVLAAADAIVATSPSARERLLQRYRVDARRVVTIPGTVDATARGDSEPAVPAILGPIVAQEYRVLAGSLVEEYVA